jgi:acyl-coenzyme A synthetase/AMP-(fatty) acid ligase
MTSSYPISPFDLLSGAASRWPEQVFIEDGNIAVSFAAMAAVVNAIASGLAKSGVGRGDRIAVLLEKRWEAVALMLAASRIGAVTVIINPLFKSAQISHILADCEPRVLFVSTPLERKLGLGSSVTGSVPVIRCLSPRAEQPGGGGSEFGRFADQSGRLPAVEPQTGMDLGCILYTSGSTGLPKGVAVPNATLVNGAQIVASYTGTQASDRILCLLPLSFDYGLNQVMQSLLVGATCVFEEYLLPGILARTLLARGITALPGSPIIWTGLSGYFMERPGERLAPLKYGTNTGGAIAEKHIRFLVDIMAPAQLFLMYGLTEAFRSSFLPPDQVLVRPRSIGKAIPGVTLSIVNEAGTECAPREIGELVHRGALVTRGYYRRVEETAKYFRAWPAPADGLLPEPCVYSGDLAYRDEEGFLYHVGRRDNMIKTRGYRVSPAQIEQVIGALPAVAIAAVVARKTADEDQDICAVVVPAEPRTVSSLTDAIRAHCVSELPGYMVPAQIIVLETLPLNSNGKVDRLALQQLAQVGTHAVAADPAPQSGQPALAATVP